VAYQPRGLELGARYCAFVILDPTVIFAAGRGKCPAQFFNIPRHGLFRVEGSAYAMAPSHLRRLSPMILYRVSGSWLPAFLGALDLLLVVFCHQGNNVELDINIDTNIRRARPSLKSLE
jgi:hypothetical protein